MAEFEKCIVILNEQHSLFPQQEELLNETCSEWSIKPVPKDGWTHAEQDAVKDELYAALYGHDDVAVIFASPVTKLYGAIKWWEGFEFGYGNVFGRVFAFSNEHREKKELPNGQIISVVSPTGWELV